MTLSPINLHTHGIHVSPKGNADNVMLNIRPGMSNAYTFASPQACRRAPIGITATCTRSAAQTYLGLAGLLTMGRADGNLPLVTANRIPIRDMVLQYNFVFDRTGGLAQLDNSLGRNRSARSTRRKAMSWRRAPTGRCLLDQLRPMKKGRHYFPSGTRARCRSATSVGALNSSRAICSDRRQIRRTGQRRPGRPVASRLQARPAIHRERAIPTGDQEQSGADRDLGARQCQRHRLHARRAHRDGDRHSPQDRHRRPGRVALSASPLSRLRERHNSSRRQPAMRLR